MEWLKRKLKTKVGMITFILIMSTVVVSLSYGSFVITSNKFKASELLISKLNYSLEIRNSKGSIVSNPVVVNNGSKEYFEIKITSVNKIDSKYNLVYKSDNKAVVEYTDKSESISEGEIKGYDTSTYTKVVRVVIDNTREESTSKVEFKVIGGYTHTSITSYGTYALLGGPYTEGSDLNLVAVTLNGQPTDKTYEELKENYIVDSVTCDNGSVGYWTGSEVAFKKVNTPDYCTIHFKTFKTLYATLTDGSKYPTINTRVNGTFQIGFDFDTMSDTTGVIYKESTWKEPGKDVYYFAGRPLDNWVSFGNFYWRIIRTNEDGSVRLLYAGVESAKGDTERAYIESSQAYNEYGSANTISAGYMYGSSGSIANNRTNTTSSSIKILIDEWYKENLLTNYDEYISKTAIYCNDRSTDSTDTSSVYFAAYDRLVQSNKRPTYKCGQKTDESMYSNVDIADKFSVSTTSGGNGQLDYPVALMTADEVSFAGGAYGSRSFDTYYYLNASNSSATGNKNWWTMSPSKLASSLLSIFIVEGNTWGSMDFGGVKYAYAVRPVISLKSCVQVTGGNGTTSTPYTVSVSDTCAGLDN